MLMDSITHADEDIKARQLAEQQVEADRAIAALESALETDGDKYLDENEKESLLNGMESLRKIRNEGDAEEIKEAISGLNELSEIFAARRMNASIQNAMAGHNINEFTE
jgi:molecular chaperone HscA